MKPKPLRRAPKPGPRKQPRRGAPAVGLRSAHFARILVPLDFSDCSHQALQHALVLAGTFRSALALLYVAETNPAGSELGASHLLELETDLRRIARQQLAKVKRQLVPPGVPCCSLIRAGRSDVEIVAAAVGWKADLIVMAARSFHSPPAQLGSTTERVARAAHCPVLLVPVQEKCVPFFL